MRKFSASYTLKKTSKAELSMLERFKNVEEHKQASKQTLKLATKFVRQFSKPMKRWKWACQKIIKTEKAKKMRQAGEIVDMAAIRID